MGQKHRFDRQPLTSGVPRSTDIPGEVGVPRAGIQGAVDKGWMVRHESGTYVKFTPAGAELFA
jgi:hypothetical protein